MNPRSYRPWATRITCDADSRSLRPPSCCSVEVMNGALGEERYGFSSTERTVKCWRARGLRPGRGPEPRRWRRPCPTAWPASSKSLPAATFVPSTATSFASNDGVVAVTSVDVPVVGGDERDPFAFALDDQAHRRALDATGRQAAVDATPQHRRHLVAVQPVEDAPRLGGVDQAVVELTGVVDRVVDRGLGDLVEHHPLHGHLRLQVLEQVPGDRLALAVFVRREIQLGRVLQRRLELFDHGLATLGELVGRLEPVVDVDVQALGRKVGHVAHRGAHVVVAAEELRQRFRLGGRFDDDEGFGHAVLSLGDRGEGCQLAVCRKRGRSASRPVPAPATVRTLASTGSAVARRIRSL